VAAPQSIRIGLRGRRLSPGLAFPSSRPHCINICRPAQSHHAGESARNLLIAELLRLQLDSFRPPLQGEPAREWPGPQVMRDSALSFIKWATNCTAGKLVTRFLFSLGWDRERLLPDPNPIRRSDAGRPLGGDRRASGSWLRRRAAHRHGSDDNHGFPLRLKM
jgi:hypothetical protein